ncbi:MAG TPA: hypothetical protein ENL44_00860, partial [Thermoplasmatales archaeon]|nr:hypothetical protein [Thermoplasmatales archaeon]
MREYSKERVMAINHPWRKLLSFFMDRDGAPAIAIEENNTVGTDKSIAVKFIFIYAVGISRNRKGISKRRIPTKDVIRTLGNFWYQPEEIFDKTLQI